MAARVSAGVYACLRRRAWSCAGVLVYYMHTCTDTHPPSPTLHRYVLDFFVDRVRAQALSVFVKAYQPDIGLDALKAMLSFEKRKDCFRWLRAQVLACMLMVARLAEARDASRASACICFLTFVFMASF